MEISAEEIKVQGLETVEQIRDAIHNYNKQRANCDTNYVNYKGDYKCKVDYMKFIRCLEKILE